MEFMVAKRDGAGTVLTFSGRLDTVASTELKIPIRAEVDHQPTSISCNFQNVTYIGSAVLRLIFEAAREQQRRHSYFRITNCSSDIRRVFALTGMDHLVEGGPGPQFTHETNQSTLRVFLHGRMDVNHVSEIRVPIRQLIQSHVGPVRFEVSAVPYAASAFVHLCIDASKLAKASGHDFGVERVMPDVAHIFRLAGLQTLLLSSV